MTSRPFTGARIETWRRRPWACPPMVAPLRGRGLKRQGTRHPQHSHDVAPLRGRGLKPWFLRAHFNGPRRPFTGARIETLVMSSISSAAAVAPLRGRGLKHLRRAVRPHQAGVAPLRGRGLKRSAWRAKRDERRRPFTGARIETPGRPGGCRRPGRRPFTGARIETNPEGDAAERHQVAPLRGRGLKLDGRVAQPPGGGSPLYGGAD